MWVFWSACAKGGDSRSQLGMLRAMAFSNPVDDLNVLCARGVCSLGPLHPRALWSAM